MSVRQLLHPLVDVVLRRSQSLGISNGIDDQQPLDAPLRLRAQRGARLRELGFVSGERVEVMAAGPIAAEPLLVQVGFTRFALRRSEAARGRVRAQAAGEPA